MKHNPYKLGAYNAQDMVFTGHVRLHVLFAQNIKANGLDETLIIFVTRS